MGTNIYVTQWTDKHDFKAWLFLKGDLIKQGHLSDIFNDGKSIILKDQIFISKPNDDYKRKKFILLKLFSKTAMGQPFDERSKESKANVMELEHGF